ncbi:MAG: radical SAM protein, partial [Verrucomicrobia bacterium]|nr:radical SAM protein [Verrucomicrobiota bacterium]
ALCPMATGISHHISPRGEIEPCPVIQFAVDNIRDSRGIFQTMRDSAFLQDFREAAARSTRGCIVLERPDLIKELVLKHGARDSTTRGTALAELDSMQPRNSQHLPGREIPEEHWMYRFAKKHWFNDFGAYGKAGSGFSGSARQNKSNLDPADQPVYPVREPTARP